MHTVSRGRCSERPPSPTPKKERPAGGRVLSGKHCGGGQRRKEIPSEDERQAERVDFTVATDGGARPNPGIGAWAAVIKDANGEERLLSGVLPHATNNAVELLAAINALESLPANSSVHVLTDSTYLRSGIVTWIPLWLRRNWQTVSGGPVANRPLWERLHSAASRLRVRWEWVRGHAGHELNQRADTECSRLIKVSSARGRLVA